jgi:5-formyltetrahydrofolate cyclo-ligase
MASAKVNTRGAHAARLARAEVHNRILRFLSLPPGGLLAMSNAMSPDTLEARKALRQSLLKAREAWSGSEALAVAQSQLSRHLQDLLLELEPSGLGLYWPIRGEFNPRPVALALQGQLNVPLALPWAFKSDGSSATKGAHMEYRAWDGSEPATTDECGIPSPQGKSMSPDVLLVPCVGYSRSGFRLGYGGGYFDRYMAAHPHVTAVGVAWSEALLDDSQLAPQSHDQPLMLIVTPEGVVG